MNKPPKKPHNKERRPREYLTPAEIRQLLSSAKRAKLTSQRDYTMILLAYRHGLRVSELVNLKWEQIDLKEGLIDIVRINNGMDDTHPLFPSEIKALSKLNKVKTGIPYVFISSRKTPVSVSMFRKIISKVGQEANIPFPVHPHMLRHSTGHKLAEEGQDERYIQLYLGHKNIQSTHIYTHSISNIYKNFWKD